MHTDAVLTHLKKHGQLLDSEISVATGISILDVRAAVSSLSSRGSVSLCDVTKFEDGIPVDRLLCRLSGFYPQAAPGRKPGITIKK
jgi:hypothetical protein